MILYEVMIFILGFICGAVVIGTLFCLIVLGVKDEDNEL